MASRVRFRCGCFHLAVAIAGISSFVGCSSNSMTVPPPPPDVTVTVAPQMAAVAATSQTQQFTATVTGSSNTSVTWSVDGVVNGNGTAGTITDGLYTPPAAGGTHTVTATSVANTSDSGSATVAVTDLPGVFTYHNDLSRDGANTQEYALSSSTVTTARFGKLFSCPVDGAVYTQPLWVPGVSIGAGTHNVIFVATQHDSLFAFDADASPCVTYWQVNLLDTLHGGKAGEGPVVWTDVGYCFGDVFPEVGVTGTPVIDSTTGTIYLVSASEIPGAMSGNCALPLGSFFHRLHALEITTGSEKFSAPVTIAASLPGIGDGSSGGVLSFNSQLHHQRSGLVLVNGTVYVAFSAHEDATPYHGWLIGYSASNVQQQQSVFNTTPNGIAGSNGGADGGIWGGGGAPAIDSVGDIYVSTGNGVYDESSMPASDDYGDSTLRLHPFSGSTSNGANLSVAGWFTPDDEVSLEKNDTDLGSGAPTLLPDQTNGPAHLLAQVGKEGVIYLIDRDNMGQFNATNGQIVQSFTGAGGLWGTPAFWQTGLYYAGAGSPLTVFPFDTTTGLFVTSAASQSNNSFNFPTATPSISSQGSSHGIAWAIDASLYGYASPNAAGGINCYQSPVPAACTGPAVLRAYDATNLGTELWNSTMAANNRDQAGNAVKFVPPTIANGKVYISTRTEVDVYGLLN
ncbi:MAG TPA: hypothetical protein VIW68_01805 [Candidatus Sulfotelmatobacter sp.]